MRDDNAARTAREIICACPDAIRIHGMHARIAKAIRDAVARERAGCAMLALESDWDGAEALAAEIRARAGKGPNHE